MKGHFGEFFVGAEYVGGCIAWSSDKDQIFHTQDWYMLEHVKDFDAIMYQVDGKEVVEMARGAVHMDCSHNVHLGHWSKGSITLERSN